MTFELTPIGVVRSPLVRRAEAPRQPDESAPAAEIHLNSDFRVALNGLAVGDRIVLLTWLHLADRAVLTVHPRGDISRPVTGVFATRSPDRPNPVGLHDVVITAIADDAVTVDGLEAVDGTPVIDLKPALEAPADR
jgi:tRNA-Thr(GGU) m(6)t(6)A37 methyltransferase TsaA